MLNSIMFWPEPNAISAGLLVSGDFIGRWFNVIAIGIRHQLKIRRHIVRKGEFFC
jgi:hypothetical protein